MRRGSRQDAAARSLIAYFQKRAKQGYPEARRDWLYGPAHVPPGAWDQEQMLDDVMRRAKDIGSDEEFELIYVYWKPPVWTCQPSADVRDMAETMEFKRELGALRRWARCAPAGSYNERLAAALAASTDAAITMLGVSATPPANDPVIQRIDAIPGLAN